MTTKQSLFTITSDLCNREKLINSELVEKIPDNCLIAKSWVSDKPFRVLQIDTKSNNSFQNFHQALLVNLDSTINVNWSDSRFLPPVRIGQIVSPNLSELLLCTGGSTKINRPYIHHRPTPQLNLFEFVPHAWVKDKELLKKAAGFLDELSVEHRLMFNAIFWNIDRFERFCRQPSSMIGHHSENNGNLRHTIEVVENIRQICLTRKYTNQSLAMLAGFLHDAGKADEYISNGKGGWSITDRGKLLGHKVTALEWIVTAVIQWKIKLPQDHYESLLHILTAVPNAPPWMGLREPAIPESLILSMADRLSGHDDLMRQTLSPAGGFGRDHKHLKSAPFKVRG